METDVSDETLPAVTVKAPLSWPAATVTLAGTLAADALLLVSCMLAPPAGAAAFKVTVADEDAPAAIELEATLTAVTAVALGEVELLGLPLPPEPPGLDVPLELPLPVEISVPLVVAPLPEAAGDAENAPFGAAPHPIKIVTEKRIAMAVASEGDNSRTRD